jgi:D-alanyl-D-alanine dipeptidase
MSLIHPEFVSVAGACPGILVAASYGTTDNFTGAVVPGYRAPVALVSRPLAERLGEAQDRARSQGLLLKVFDGYRPAKAVRFFQEWARGPEDNPALKERFYPTYTRAELFERGFIAARSSHSRGAAVDLTLALPTGEELDMGTEFDFFHERSFTESPLVGETARANRRRLRDVMEAAGFRNFPHEWWHFSLRTEPFPEQYFDFDVGPDYS